MSSRDRNRFYLFWTLAIVLCFVLAVFALFFASCGTVTVNDGSGAEPSGEPSAYVMTEKGIL